MTGWRVGWMVLPEPLIRPVERIAQNLYISAPDISQRAAIAAFEASDELDRIRDGYAANRRLLLDRLPAIGFDEHLPVDGAFYVYASVRRFSNDSTEFTRRMLAEAGVAATPGAGFRPGPRPRLHALLLRRHRGRHGGGHGPAGRLAEIGSVGRPVVSGRSESGKFPLRMAPLGYDGPHQRWFSRGARLTHRPRVQGCQ